MDTRGAVAIILASTVLIFVVGDGLLDYAYPDHEPANEAEADVWKAILGTIIGGLCVYIAGGNDKQ